MANTIFLNIKDYGFMHSSHTIIEAVIEAIRVELPSIGSYLDSRIVHVPHLFQSMTQPEIRESCIRETPAMGEYGYTRANIWFPEQDVKQ